MKLLLPFHFIRSWILYKCRSFSLRKTDYFHYEELTKKEFPAPTSFASVTIYGNYKAVAQLKKSAFNFITEYLEHGCSFSSDINSIELLGYANRPFIRKIYTFSNNRKATIEKYLKSKKLKREVIPIGPYIKGVKFFKTENELLKLKEKYGRILLVFPSHSIETVKSEYDHDEFAKEILRVSSDFDSVFICLYWKDIQLRSFYLDKSPKLHIVTAGHRSDPKFLSRLKDLISLSSHTMSNNIGTHIGYSVCMEKPHYLYTQKSDYINTENSSKVNVDSSYYDIKEVFCSQFGTYESEITSAQLKLVKKYWGDW